MLTSFALAAALTMAPQTAAAPLAEVPVSIGPAASALHGTLRPAGSDAPAVLILAGSGPTDRDGNNPLGVKAATYRLLAEALAERGIATLRVDKRGIGQSAGAATREEDLRIETYADDARTWASELKRRTSAPCIWLLGHSEGALVAQLAARAAPDVCGLVLVSGPGRKGGDVLREQLGPQLPEPLKTRAFAAIADLEAGRAADGPPELAGLFRPSVQPYLISWLRHDPAELLRAYRGPVLIVHGDTDLQAALADAERLKAASSAAELVRFAGVNHVLKTAPADRPGNLATYSDPALPLAPGVADAIARFVSEKTPRRPAR